MAVNNYGSNDVRVVKSAELSVKNGNTCIVLCLSKSRNNIHEIINGVHYYRLKMRYGLYALWLGFFPDQVTNFAKKFKPPSFSSSSIKNDHDSFIKDGHLLPNAFNKKSFLFIEKSIRVILKNAFIHNLLIKFRQGIFLTIRILLIL